MKRLFFMLNILMVMISCCLAQDTENLAPFRKKGYKVTWLQRNSSGSFGEYTCEVKKFKECDSLYYMIYKRPDTRKYCVQFAFLNETGARQLAAELEKRSMRNRGEFMRYLMKETHADELDHLRRYNKFWTYFKPRINERFSKFNLNVAIYGYNIERERKNPYKDISPQQWLFLIKAMGGLLPIIGAGMDDRPLYDKVVNPKNI